MNNQFDRRAFLRGVSSAAAVAGTGLLGMGSASAQITVPGSKKYGVKAVVFDMYGTVLDVHGTYMREAKKILEPRGFKLDWLKLATDMFRAYPRSIIPIQKGEVPWVNTDVLFRRNLAEVLPTFGVKDQPPEVMEALHQIWHQLDAWPDVKQGMADLRKTCFIATCSNGNVAMMADIARHNEIDFDALLGSEWARFYKPDPRAYQMTADALGVKTSEVLFVGGASHTSDFAGAAATGMKTASVARPDEGGVKGKNPTEPKFAVTVHSTDLIDLAKKIANT